MFIVVALAAGVGAARPEKKVEGAAKVLAAGVGAAKVEADVGAAQVLAAGVAGDEAATRSGETCNNVFFSFYDSGTSRVTAVFWALL